ncbi:MAG: DUF1552 domain-containing protein [Planctomycetota bacterium]
MTKDPFRRFRLDRRQVLRGAGATILLPFLEPLAAASRLSRFADRPVRTAWIYFPNGVAEGAWEPETKRRRGTIQKLNEWMSPLEPHRSEILIPTEMWTPDGNGHGAGTATWLTGSGYDDLEVRTGDRSIDQTIAASIGSQTLLPSLQLSTRGEGYFAKDLPRNSLSWERSDRPAFRDRNPRAVFDRMFRAGSQSNRDREILDVVLEDARDLRRQLGAIDRDKLDEYLESIRGIERRLKFAEERSAKPLEPDGMGSSRSAPDASLSLTYSEQIDVWFELIALAFKTDATRTVTLMLDHGQSNRYCEFLDDVRGTWHALSHWRDASGQTEDDDGKTSWSSRREKRDMYNSVTRFHHERLAKFLTELRATQDGDGSLLDQSLILYGSSIADGHEHEEQNLPILLAGRGGGAANPGRMLRHRRPTDLAGIHLAMARAAGVPVERLGEADEPIDLRD